MWPVNIQPIYSGPARTCGSFVRYTYLKIATRKGARVRGGGGGGGGGAGAIVQSIVRPPV